MAKNSLVIVESPTKAKTIKKFLPKNFRVEACIGHVRDLPQSASDVPAKYKQEDWTKLGVNIDDDFSPLYVVPKTKKKVIQNLKQALAKADELYLATDEDREGESISWHLLQILKPKIPVKRMVFHEITKSAIENALANPRDIDDKLVSAQEARRILDRLVGYTLSPLIWKKISYGLSAGRVQSVATKLIVKREEERLKFVPSEYWDLSAQLDSQGSAFPAKLNSIDGKKIAQGRDFNDKGKLSDKAKNVEIIDENKAQQLVKQLKTKTWQVTKVEKKPFSSKPPIPFITSTFQQEANRKLGLSSKVAMQAAQRLYEQGFITYMRTDSPNLSQEGIKQARRCVKEVFGDKFLSDKPRNFAAKSKGAQEAHEAIRPAGNFVHPDKAGLDGREKKVYEFIWKRTLATQMAEAKKQSMHVSIKADNTVFNASGTSILFAGFLRAYVEGSDDPQAALADKEVLLPKLSEGETLKLLKLDPHSHQTKAIARFTEASLIREMEKEGIGRPSTYAAIMSTIVDRGYVNKNGHAMIPTFTGFAVTHLLEKHFEEFIDLGFTSEMEKSLDDIAEGSEEMVPYLSRIYLGPKGLRAQVEKQDKKIDPNEARLIQLKSIPQGVEIRVGRYGAYLEKPAKKKSDDPIKATLPHDLSPADISADKIEEIIELSKKGPESIGKHPNTGEDIFVLSGRYGPYVQLGPVTDDNPKPKRASVPKGKNPNEVTLDEAVHWLILPRDLGPHPDTGVMIIANKGRFGPYIGHQKDYRSLKAADGDDVYTITLKRALEIFAQPKRGRGGSVRVRDLGEHPLDKKNLAIYEGKYGLFIKHGSKNISFPKDKDHKTISLDEVVKLTGGGEVPKKTQAKKKAQKNKKVTKRKPSSKSA